MELPTILLQFCGSLIAIFALFGLAKALRLGGKPRLKDEESVRIAAAEVEDGFSAARIAISKKGEAAITSDANGRIMLIKRHGNRFAGRILESSARTFEEVDGIIVDCGDAQFGKVRLSIENPGIWVDAINRL